MAKLIFKPKAAKLYRDVAFIFAMDPFVKITYKGDYKVTQPHMGGGVRPHWRNEELLFKVTGGEILITIYDKNFITDSEVGSCILNVDSLVRISPFRDWVKIKYHDYVVGELDLEIISAEDRMADWRYEEDRMRRPVSFGNLLDTYRGRQSIYSKTDDLYREQRDTYRGSRDTYSAPRDTYSAPRDTYSGSRVRYFT